MPRIVRSAVAPPRPATVGAAPTLIACLVLTASFCGLTLLVKLKWSVLMAFDRDRLVQLRHVDARSSLFLDAMRMVSALASPTAWIVVLGAVAVGLLLRRRVRLAAFVVVTGVGNPILNATVKGFVRRPRPLLARPVEVASGWSFPSAHTQAATVGCGVLLVVLAPSLSRAAARWAVLAAVVVIAVVALSRMSLGLHYPSDVAAAVLCGSGVDILHRRGLSCAQAAPPVVGRIPLVAHQGHGSDEVLRHANPVYPPPAVAAPDRAWNPHGTSRHHDAEAALRAGHGERHPGQIVAGQGVRSPLRAPRGVPTVRSPSALHRSSGCASAWVSVGRRGRRPEPGRRCALNRPPSPLPSWRLALMVASLTRRRASARLPLRAAPSWRLEQGGQSGFLLGAQGADEPAQHRRVIASAVEHRVHPRRDQPGPVEHRRVRMARPTC